MIHCKYCGDEARHKLDGEVDVCYDCCVRLYKTPEEGRQVQVFDSLQRIHASVMKMPIAFSYREDWLKHLSDRLSWATVAMGRPAPYEAFAADQEPLPDRTLLHTDLSGMVPAQLPKLTIFAATDLAGPKPESVSVIFSEVGGPLAEPYEYTTKAEVAFPSTKEDARAAAEQYIKSVKTVKTASKPMKIRSK